MNSTAKPSSQPPSQPNPPATSAAPLNNSNKAAQIAHQIAHLRASVLDVPARAKQLTRDGYTFPRIDGEPGAFDVVKPDTTKPAYQVRLFRSTQGNAKNGWGYSCSCRFFWAMGWASRLDKSLVPQCKHGHFVLARFLKQLAGVEHVTGCDVSSRRSGHVPCTTSSTRRDTSR